MSKSFNHFKENIYGHLKRLEWIASNIKHENKILEFGCGTGYMITLPLIQNGFNAVGIDLDKESISYGKEVFTKEGLSSKNLICDDVSNIQTQFDVIIASEVLEHIPDNILPEILSLFHNKLNNEGLLLITVPNGYGWFELEHFFWNKLKLGKLLENLKAITIISIIKQFFLGKEIEPKHPSTLSGSPHVQRFTLKSIIKLLETHNFKVVDKRGSVLFAGLFSNLFFTGINPIMDLNCILGDCFPYLASGFYIAAKKISERI